MHSGGPWSFGTIGGASGANRGGIILAPTGGIPESTPLLALASMLIADKDGLEDAELVVDDDCEAVRLLVLPNGPSPNIMISPVL